MINYWHDADKQANKRERIKTAVEETAVWFAA